MSNDTTDILKNLRVLLLEDNDDQRKLVEWTLRRAGASVSCVSTVADALSEVDDFLPDVVVSDLRLPDRDGIDFIEDLRKKHPGLPAIAMTASADVETKKRTLKAGFDTFIPKPCRPATLVMHIAHRNMHGRHERSVPRHGPAHPI